MTAGTVVAVVGDTHIGSYTALSLPTWMLMGKPGEEVEYQANLAQNWIYEKWQDYWGYVKTLAGVKGKTRKHRIVAVHVGDIVDGVHHQTIQSLQNPDDQIDMAAEIMEQVANLADGGLYLTIGTEVHAGPNGSYEYRISKRVGAKQIDQSLLLDIDGLRILVYHHGRASKRDWTSTAAGMAVEARLDAQESGQPVPRYVFSGHNHTIDDSGEKDCQCRAVALPSWQLRTAFGWRVGPGKTRSDIGGMIILPDGTLDWSRMRYVAPPGGRKVTVV